MAVTSPPTQVFGWLLQAWSVLSPLRCTTMLTDNEEKLLEI